MDFQTKRRLTYGTIAFMFIFSGVEYAIVLPTIWAYLKKLGAKDQTLLGLAIGAFSLPSILFGPIIGKLFDKYHNAKAILFIVNTFEIFGSIVYFLAPSPWFVVASRFICGIGCSGVAIVFADISNSTPVEERTPVITAFQACTQIGLLIGPAFNLLLRELDFKIGYFVVDKFTAPGLFMAGVGIILEILFITVYFNLGTLYNKQRLVESLQHSYANESLDRGPFGNNVVEGARACLSINGSRGSDHIDVGLDNSLHNNGSGTLIVICKDAVEAVENASARISPGHFKRRMFQRPTSPGSDDMIEDAENFMCGISESFWQTQNSRPGSRISKHSDSQNPDSVVDTISSNNTDDKIRSISISTDIPICQNRAIPMQWSQSFQPYKDEFLRDEVIVLLGLSFVAYFAQSSLETIATPLTQRIYGFNDFANSLFFLACGCEIIFTFMLIRLLSRRIEDRFLILIGTILMIFSLAWYLVIIPNIHHGDWGSFPYFIVGIFTNLLGTSLLITCCISLYSKLISQSNQGIGHGIRRTVLSVGMILGPLWGGTALHTTRVLFIVPLVMISSFSILFFISFERLRADKQCGDAIVIQQGSARHSSRLSRNSVIDESSSLLHRSQ